MKEELSSEMRTGIIYRPGAEISPCGQYRYKLWRYWNLTKPLCLFIMLNPSTADEVENDPTVERCERRAKKLGFGGIMICNLFASRATNPMKMKEAADPVGPDNNEHLIAESARAGMVICGWGEHGKYMDRSKFVLEMLAGIPLYYLRLNKSGEPGHPLYIGYDQEPQLWKGAA